MKKISFLNYFIPFVLLAIFGTLECRCSISKKSHIKAMRRRKKRIKDDFFETKSKSVEFNDMKAEYFIIKNEKNQYEQASSDLFIFSYDRPLQLYALLESIKKHIKGIEDIFVLYRASAKEFSSAYSRLVEEFSDVWFVKQSNPPNDFKELFLTILRESTTSYALFAVDDIIVKDDVNLSECIQVLEQTKAYGFYLRLGQNITGPHEHKKREMLPVHFKVSNQIYVWQFAQGNYDWHYPNTVDMTLYRKSEILPYLQHLSYKNPNALESQWAASFAQWNKTGLFFSESKVVNIPVNRVGEQSTAPVMNSYSLKDLLSFFEKGLKIDIAFFYKINNTAPHMDYKISFLQHHIRS